MVALTPSQKAPTKYSTIYRWNGYFGHLSKVTNGHKYLFWTLWIPA